MALEMLALYSNRMKFMAMFSISVETGVFLRIAASLGIFVFILYLVAMFRRESVKSDLLQRNCKPIRIWWIGCAWWSPWFDAMPFRVIYSDQNCFIHKAHCWVGHRLFDSPFGPRRVVWVKDNIVGELPLPEVWAESEIVRPKLNEENPQTDNLLDESRQ